MATATLARPTTCIWCDQRLTDGREESGFTGTGPDWMADGDFGCNDSPWTGEDGTGRHVARSSIRALLMGKLESSDSALDGPEVAAIMAKL